MAVKANIEKLFVYLDAFESQPAAFETQAFIQTYNGVRAVFRVLREQRDQAVEVDYTFLDFIKQVPLTASDLREITVQILICYFEAEADVDGRTNQSYSYCRGQRPVKQDVPYIEEKLAPLLFRERALNNNEQLHGFMLDEICAFLNTHGRSLKADLTPEEFDRLKDPIKMLVLARRRHQFGTALLNDRSSLEFDLHRVNAFHKLGSKNRAFEQYFKNWNYLYKPSFWTRVKTTITELGGKGRGIFSSFRYTRLVFSQRGPAFVKYVVFIVFWIVLAILVPRWWLEHDDSQLQKMNQRVQNVGQHVSER